MANFETIGLIGAGLLGQAIVERLLVRGMSAVGWDVEPLRWREFAALGGRRRR